MPPTITAFEASPDRGRGLARDMRVRWALEEVGQPYDVRLVSFAAMKQPPHLALHPFGQIPTFEDGGLALFESVALGDVQHDGARLEEHQPVLLIDGHLPKWLHAPVAVGLLVLGTDQPLLIRKARLFERPAHAKIPHQALGERRYPLECTHTDH